MTLENRENGSPDAPQRAAWLRGSIPGMPSVLAREPVAAQMAAAVYGHCLVAARVADVSAHARDRVEGGRGAVARLSDHGRAARALAELEAAIGRGTVCLGRAAIEWEEDGRRRRRLGEPVLVAEIWLVRRVAVEWRSLRWVIAASSLPYSARRAEVLGCALSRALARMSGCRAVELHR